jgi:uncharacterized protein YbjT (DUF2867 family)
MKIAVLGGNGYIGRHLINSIIKNSEDTIVSLSPNSETMHFDSRRVITKNLNVFDTDSLHDELKDCDVVYYLIHMMAQHKIDFAEAEEKAAQSLVAAVTGTSVERIIYLGGLGDDATELSKHLASRHHTGNILRTCNTKVIEFRASMVVGDGSISYDIITNLVHKLPILTLPSWSKTLTQPIGLEDAISYLSSASKISLSENQIVEIGGPNSMSYKALMQSYAKWKHTKAIFIDMPVIPVSIAAWWLNLFTPKRHAKVGRAMVESLKNPMVVTNNTASQLFPDIHPRSIEDCFV